MIFPSVWGLQFLKNIPKDIIWKLLAVDISEEMYMSGDINESLCHITKYAFDFLKAEFDLKERTKKFNYLKFQICINNFYAN